jgi:hypothetical protein
MLTHTGQLPCPCVCGHCYCCFYPVFLHTHTSHVPSQMPVCIPGVVYCLSPCCPGASVALLGSGISDYGLGLCLSKGCGRVAPSLTLSERGLLHECCNTGVVVTQQPTAWLARHVAAVRPVCGNGHSRALTLSLAQPTRHQVTLFTTARGLHGMLQP